MPWLSSYEEDRAHADCGSLCHAGFCAKPGDNSHSSSRFRHPARLTWRSITTTEESSEDNVETITPSPEPTVTPEAN